jgi:hypothetical protein
MSGGFPSKEPMPLNTDGTQMTLTAGVTPTYNWINVNIYPPMTFATLGLVPYGATTL